MLSILPVIPMLGDVGLLGDVKPGGVRRPY